MTSHIDTVARSSSAKTPAGGLDGCMDAGGDVRAPLHRREPLADLGPCSAPPGPRGRPGWCDHAPAQAHSKGVGAGPVILTPGVKLTVPQAGRRVSTLGGPLALGPQELRLPLRMDHVAQEQPPVAAWAFFPTLAHPHWFLVLHFWSLGVSGSEVSPPSILAGSQLPQGTLAPHGLGPGNSFCSDPRWLL